MSPAWANAQRVRLERQWQQLGHQRTMGWGTENTTKGIKEVNVQQTFWTLMLSYVWRKRERPLQSLREFSVFCLSFSDISVWPAGAVGSGAFLLLSSSSSSHCFFRSLRLSILYTTGMSGRKHQQKHRNYCIINYFIYLHLIKILTTGAPDPSLHWEQVYLRGWSMTATDEAPCVLQLAHYALWSLWTDLVAAVK